MIAVLITFLMSANAFAAEGVSIPDSVDLELQIKQDENEFFYDGSIALDDIYVTYFGILSDGSILLNISRRLGTIDVTYTHVFGNYQYSYHAGNEAYIYKDNTFQFLVDAYNSGMISDSMLDEMYNCSVEYLKNPVDSTYYFMNKLEVEPTTPPIEEITQTVTTEPVTIIPVLGIYGDVNKDSVVNVNDVIDIQKDGLDMISFDETSTVLGDVNGDVRISILDVTYVQKYIAGADYNTKLVGQPYYG